MMPEKGHVDAGIRLETKKRAGPWRRLVLRMDKVFYPDYVLRSDDYLCRDRILAYLGKDKTVLDLGAGSGIYEHTNFRGLAARVCGIDPSPRVAENPHLDEASVGYAGSMPFEGRSFDVVFAWNVLEHLVAPENVFSEVSRVLKPGGVFVAKTPNQWHYIGLISRWTPRWFHEVVIARLFRWRRPEDVFPTVYHANSIPTLHRLAHDAGLRVEEIHAIEPRPEYLRFSPFTYPFGIAYERIVNAWPGFQVLRAVIVIVFKKPVDDPKP